MATVKAFIRTSAKNKGLTNVRFRLTDGRSVQLFHKSDFQVNTDDWDSKGEKIKAKVIFNAKQRKTFDKGITDRKNLISDLYDEALETIDKSNLTSAWLDDAIDKSLYPEKHVDEQPAQTTLLTHIADFIAKAPTRKKKKSTAFISPATIKSYVSNQNRLIAFAKHKKKKDFEFSEINAKFYDDYVNFLTNRKRVVRTVQGEEKNETRQYSLNTIGEAIKSLKTMIADVKEVNIEMKDLYVFTEEVNNVYLDETELQKLKDLNLKDTPHLDRVRDNFLLLAWTCSRISDLPKIVNIKNGFIEYRQTKTNNEVIIPIHPVVKSILNKYDGKLPVTSDKNLNTYIKECCRLAGIDQLETISRTVGGVSTQKTVPKYELISSHTGRRSFCTNMYKQGLDTLMIMSISGHKTETAFLTYIKVSKKEHAERMAQKWNEFYN